MNLFNPQPRISLSPSQRWCWQYLLLMVVRQLTTIKKGKGLSNFHVGWGKYVLSSLLILAANPTTAIAALDPNSLPNSTPTTPTDLSSCQNLAFGSFVPDRSPYTTVRGNARYSIDTVWTATASDGTTATLRSVQVNNNSGNFDTTGNNANVFFTGFADPNSDNDSDPSNDFVSPKLNVGRGVAADGDSWDVQVEYSRPISNARLLFGDVDSENRFFKDVASAEGFLGNASVAPSNAYQGSELTNNLQGNTYTFQDQGAIGPNPGDAARSNRAVVDYEDTYIDNFQITYAVGGDASYTRAGNQALFLSSGMSAGCNIGGSVFQDSNGNDLFNSGEFLLNSVAVSAYLDDGDGIFETNGDDLLIETQDTTTGAYEFTNLAENESYWVTVDESDADLDSYQYSGGDIESSQINPRLISVANGNVSDVNFPFNAINILGTIFEDANGNNTKDSSESPLANVFVALFRDLDNNGILNSADDPNGDGLSLNDAVKQGSSDIDGNYSFDVPDGNYLVYINQNDADLVGRAYGGVINVPNDPLNNRRNADISGTNILSGLDFPFDPANITGTIFEDVNQNDIKDSSEPIFPNVGVFLFRDLNNDGRLTNADDPNGGTLGFNDAIDTMNSDANGNYGFSAPDGNYIVFVDANDADLDGRIYGGVTGIPNDPLNNRRNADISGANILSGLDFPFDPIEIPNICNTGDPTDQINFLNNPILVEGSASQIGAVYRFNTVFDNVDALVEVVQFNNGATLGAIDNDVNGTTSAFQPTLNATSNSNTAIDIISSVDFEITLIDKTTGLPAFMNFKAAGIDIDGSSNMREFIELGNIASSTLSPDTTIDRSNPSSSITRFESRNNDVQPGINFNTSKTLVVAEYNNTSQFRYSIGAINEGNTAPSGLARLNSLFIGCAERVESDLDFGDAPDTYGTDLTVGNSSNNSDPLGAIHLIDPDLFLGTTVPDADDNGFVDGTDDNGNATDDDDPSGTGTGNGDDEDNFTLPNLTSGDTSYTIPAANLVATNNTGETATLHAWIDFDNSGTFEDTEHASVTVNDTTPDDNPTEDLTWNNINVGAVGDTYARFRLTTDNAIDNTTPGGAAINGEVEDYQIAIASPPVPAPGTCPNIPVGFVDVSFENATNGGDLELGDIARFDNVATVDGQVLDLLVEVTAMQNITTLENIGPRSNSLLGFLLENGSTAQDTVYEATLEYTFVSDGTTTPIPTSFELFIDDIDLINGQRQESITLLTNEFDTYIVDANSDLDLSFDGTSFTASGTANHSSGEPEAAIKFLMTDRSSFTITHRAKQLTGSSTGRTGFRIDMEDLTVLGKCDRYDYGDAPDTGAGTSSGNYETLFENGGAAHKIVDGLYLGGQAPDADNNGIPSTAADGDDNSAAGSAFDDEEGVQLGSDDLQGETLNRGESVTLNIATQGAGVLNAWFDWNADGDFDDTDEQVSTNVSPTANAIALDVDVPNNAAIGTTYARFRYSSDLDLSPNGLASDGEVEDYQIAIASTTPTITCPTEAGDTGSGYATSGTGNYRDDIFWLDWSCGVNTQFNPGDVVEKTWTAPNGVSVTATISNITQTLASYNTGAWSGDKLDELYGGVNPIGLTNQTDSQDPTYDIAFSMSLNGVPIPADIVAADAEDTGNTNESVTWNTDGTPWQPLEAAPNSRLNARFDNGGQSLYIEDPNTTFGGGTLLALTENVSTISVDMKAGGKEAIAFGIMIPFDYGDANGYPSSGGHLARRTATGGSQPTTVTPVNNLTMADLVNDSPYLGAIGPDIDPAENSDRPTINADGDDSSELDDEDGIFLTRLRAGDTKYTIPQESIIANTVGTATLHAWIDFNRDSEFGTGEYQSVTINNGTVSGDLTWSNLSNITAGKTYARFRITTDSNINDSTPYGAAIDGEMEDYRMAIAPAPLCPAARADLWFANDESGSVSATEFEDALDFIYQISDGFVYDDNTGMKAGITGWTNLTNSAEIVIPITESFGDSGDFGLFQDNNISLNNNNEGIRKLYANRQQSPSPTTRLDYATEYLTSLITVDNNGNPQNGRRANTPQVAIILTDADSSSIELENSDEDFVWVEAAKKLRRTGTKIIVVLIDEAATAYDAGGNSEFVANRVAGRTGRVVTVPKYTDAANPTLNYIQEVSQAICDLSTPVATDPDLLLVKRITAIYPSQPGEPDIQFNDFVDQPNFNADNHPLWPDSDENPSSNKNLYLRGALNGGRVKPGDEVEYTIYFLSIGDEPAKEVNICDVVPDNLTFVKDAYGQELGIALGFDPTVVQLSPNKPLSNLLNDDVGDFYAPGTSPPSGLCKKVRQDYDPNLDPADGKDNNPNLVTVDGSNNDNGAIIVRPADSLPPATSPGQPAGSYGFIRFRGKVK